MRSLANAWLAAGHAVFEVAQPSPQRLDRRLQRTRRYDALDADLGDRLRRREQDFVQAFAWPYSGELDLDVPARLQTRQLDDVLGELHDPDRLAHVKHVDGDIRALRTECVTR